jgi:hypothetical protein
MLYFLYYDIIFFLTTMITTITHRLRKSNLTPPQPPLTIPGPSLLKSLATAKNHEQSHPRFLF